MQYPSGGRVTSHPLNWHPAVVDPKWPLVCPATVGILLPYTGQQTSLQWQDTGLLANLQWNKRIVLIPLGWPNGFVEQAFGLVALPIAILPLFPSPHPAETIRQRMGALPRHAVQVQQWGTDVSVHIPAVPRRRWSRQQPHQLSNFLHHQRIAPLSASFRASGSLATGCHTEKKKAKWVALVPQGQLSLPLEQAGTVVAYALWHIPLLVATPRLRCNNLV